MSKPITEMNLQELMEIAKKPIKEDEFKKLPPARRFVLSEGIEVGTYRMPASLIYDRYLNWATAYKVKPANKNEFFKEFAKYFDKIRTTAGYAYLTSPKGFDLSPEYLAMVNEKHKITKGKRTSSGAKVKKERASTVARKSASDENS